MSQLTIQLSVGTSDARQIPVEVVSSGIDDEGQPLYAKILTAGPNVAIREDLVPGNYLLRCRLPNGRLISKTVRLKEGADELVWLDGTAYSPRETMAWGYVMQSVQRKLPAQSDACFESKRSTPWVPPAMPKVRCWRTVPGGPWNMGNRLLPTQANFDSQSLTLDVHQEPLVVEVQDATPTRLPSGEIAVSTLFKVPMGIAQAMLVADGTSGQKFADAPWSLALNFAGGTATSIFGYLSRGEYESAKATGRGGEFVDQAVSLLYDKHRDYASAAVGAHYLIKTQSIPHDQAKVGRIMEWLRNLDESFVQYSDGAILHAAALMHLNRAEEAGKRLLAAVERGLPCFTSSMRTLVDSLKLLQPEERQPRHPLTLALAQVAPWAASIDWELPVLALRGTLESRSDGPCALVNLSDLHHRELRQIPNAKSAAAEDDTPGERFGGGMASM